MDLEDQQFKKMVVDYFDTLEVKPISVRQLRTAECLRFDEVESVALDPAHSLWQAKASHIEGCRWCQRVISAAKALQQSEHSMPMNEWSQALRKHLAGALNRLSVVEPEDKKEYVNIDAHGILHIPTGASSQTSRVAVRLMDADNRLQLGHSIQKPGDTEVAIDISHLGSEFRNRLLLRESVEIEEQEP